jgi:delta-aminolevulinic acid dehydratase/porphobilinogen synthase
MLPTLHHLDILRAIIAPMTAPVMGYRPISEYLMGVYSVYDCE